MRATFQLTLLGILLTATGSIAQTSAVDLNIIVSRMQTASAGLNHDLAYSVTREYTLTPENATKSARVIAQVNSVAGKKDYTITEGSGQAENIVRKVLDHEAEVARDHTSVDINSRNYSFNYLGTEAIDGHTCYVLGLMPRQDSKEFLKGKAWVDADSYLIRQISGTPAKMPSWWIKDVQFTLHYRDVQGVWLQDSGKAVAQVRIVGTHTLTARALNVQTSTELASKTAPQAVPATARKRTRRNNSALLGAGVFPNH
jgi:hypothetical protein